MSGEEDGGVWSLPLHSLHHLPGPRHEEGGPHPTLKGHKQSDLRCSTRADLKTSHCLTYVR